jgi:hypothetical protein
MLVKKKKKEKKGSFVEKTVTKQGDLTAAKSKQGG